MNSIKTLSILIIVTVMNYGCSSDSSTPSPNGIYSGTIIGGEPTFNGIEEKGIIYNDRLMVLSRKDSGLSQFFDGSLTAENMLLAGSGARYNDTALINNVDFDGSFIGSQSAVIDFVATGTNSNGLPPGTINLTASPALLAKGSATSRLQGSWSGGFGSGFFGQMNLSLDASGTIISGDDQRGDNSQGGELDCVFTGTITPADAAVNAYNASITSDGGTGPFNCTVPAGNYTGLAWTEGGADDTLVLMVTDGSRGRAVILTKN